jgi:hypothetical protein
MGIEQRVGLVDKALKLVQRPVRPVQRHQRRPAHLARVRRQASRSPAA